MVKTIYCSGYNEISFAGKEILSSELKKKLKLKDKVLLAIPGGKSVRKLLSLVASEEGIDWGKIEVFLIDERIVPVGSVERNYFQAEEVFFNSAKNIKSYPFQVNKGVEYYNKLLFSKSEGKMAFDIVLIASGADCHIAGLFPKHTSIFFSKKEYFCFNDSPKLPLKRVTASREIIKNSDTGILIFAYKNRVAAYRKLMDEKNDFTDCPAKIALDMKKLYIVHPYKNQEQVG